MDSKIPLLILKNRAKLLKLINENAPYDKIIKQSKTLDKYLMIKMKYINKTKSFQ